MTITQKISMDFMRTDVPPIVAAVQGDTYTREVQISLYAAGVPWELPEGHDVAIRYRKPDGTCGNYDTMPDGSMAWKTEGNTVSIMLCPQMLTVPGNVPAQVSVILGERTVSTFTFVVNVEADPSRGAQTSENYFNWRGAFLPQPSEPVQVGDYLQVAEVDEQGRITALVAVDAPSGGGSGLPMALRVAIYNLLMDAVYQSSGHESDKAALAELLTGGGSGDEPDTGKTLTSISANYSGGDVAVGTAVSALTGIVVTAHYSDGTSATVTGYILSGTISEGSNTITVSYGGKTTTFMVTGTAESGGSDAVNLYSGELLKNSGISDITKNGNAISYTVDTNGGTATFTIENLEANKDYTIFVESTRTDDGGRYTMVSVNTGNAANYTGKLVTVYPSYADAGNNYGTFTANGETMYLWCNEVGVNVVATSVTLTVYIYEGVLTEKP